jgi:penicillin-binding protein 2
VSDSFLLSKPERDRRPLRFVAFGIIAVLVFGVLTTRLAYLQVTNGQTFTTRTEAQRTVEEPIPAPRGLIYDRKGRLLVSNVASWTVRVKPADLPFSRRQDVAKRLGALLRMDASDIIATMDTAPGSRFDPVRIATDVPEKTARLVSESTEELPGVEVAVETRRQYPDGPLLSHILGYTGSIDGATYARLKASGYLEDDSIGEAGVEATFEEQLRGAYGSELV